MFLVSCILLVKRLVFLLFIFENYIFVSCILIAQILDMLFPLVCDISSRCNIVIVVSYDVVHCVWKKSTP